jgi:hypothetical protein
MLKEKWEKGVAALGLILLATLGLPAMDIHLFMDCQPTTAGGQICEPGILSHLFSTATANPNTVAPGGSVELIFTLDDVTGPNYGHTQYIKYSLLDNSNNQIDSYSRIFDYNSYVSSCTQSPCPYQWVRYYYPPKTIATGTYTAKAWVEQDNGIKQSSTASTTFTISTPTTTLKPTTTTLKTGICITNSDCSQGLHCVDGVCSSKTCSQVCSSYGYPAGQCALDCKNIGDWLGYNVVSFNPPYAIGGEIGVCPGDQWCCCLASTTPTTQPPTTTTLASGKCKTDADCKTAPKFHCLLPAGYCIDQLGPQPTTPTTQPPSPTPTLPSPTTTQPSGTPQLPSCGGEGQQCCSGTTCNNANLQCLDGTCQAPIQHYACSSNHCILVPGAGQNECYLDGQCQGSAQQCTTTADCPTLPDGCAIPHCVNWKCQYTMGECSTTTTTQQQQQKQVICTASQTNIGGGCYDNIILIGGVAFAILIFMLIALR